MTKCCFYGGNIITSWLDGAMLAVPLKLANMSPVSCFIFEKQIWQRSFISCNTVHPQTILLRWRDLADGQLVVFYIVFTASQQQRGTSQLSIMTSYVPNGAATGHHQSQRSQTFMVNARPSKELCVRDSCCLWPTVSVGPDIAGVWSHRQTHFKKDMVSPGNYGSGFSDGTPHTHTATHFE